LLYVKQTTYFIINAKYLAVKQWGMGATGIDMPISKMSDNIEAEKSYINVAVCGWTYN
jgi:hypothetical protein